MTSSGFQPGDVVSGYRIEGVLGHGGMGTVYRAANPTLPRSDALKILGAELSRDEMFRARFEREAAVAAQLSHPNIVAVYAQGQTEGGQLWIAMQYVPGTDAGEQLGVGVMTPARAVYITTEVAKALDYAHRRGIVHRDIKPANFLLTTEDHDDERVFLADFGIARAFDDAVHLTTDGTVMASVAYAAPEALSGVTVDHRADIYSLGCSLFTLLTRKSPYAGLPGVAAIATAHLQAPPPRPTDLVPGLPRAIDAVIAKAMAKDPTQRYQTARELAEAAAEAINNATTALPRSTMTQEWSSPTGAPPRPPAQPGTGYGSGPQPVPYPTGPFSDPHAPTQPRGLMPQGGHSAPPMPPGPRNNAGRPAASPETARKRRLAIIGAVVAVVALVAVLATVYLTALPSGAPYTAQTFTHMHGSTEIKAAPTAVAALGPGDADAVLALGVQPVAIGGVGAEPPSWLKDKITGKPAVMNFVDTNSIKGAHPDVIIATGDIDDTTYQRLKEIAPTITRPADTSAVWNWQTQLQWISKIVGRESTATSLISQAGAQQTDLKNQNGKLIGKTVSVLNYADDTITQTLTPSFAADFLTGLGLNYDNKLQRQPADKSSTRVLADQSKLYLIQANLVIVVRTDKAAGGGGQSGLPGALTFNPGLIVVDDPAVVAALADPGGYLAIQFLDSRFVPMLAGVS
ncbi:serine/threonine-protein kinase [Mycolicibacterium llatzerense]|uniref:serine/threonine-protein kinase n=1 Tax=Mycolicibacterium llatzerense TaxID=280871 RepID=UPI0008DE85FF|nr:serine/threonine-protein kinase [Mycolicibacterium llatzerense]